MFESLATMAVQDWAVFAVWGINAILALALVIILLTISNLLGWA